MASIGTLVGFLRLDDSQYQRALNQNAARSKNFAKSVASSLGSLALRTAGPAALGAGLLKLGKDALALGADLRRMASAAGVSTREIQVLDFVARQNAASGDDFAKVLNRITRQLSDAEAGSATARDNFATLGLSWRTLADQPPIAALVEVARAMDRSTDRAGAFAAATRVLGDENLPKLRGALQDLARRGFAGSEQAAEAWGNIIDTGTTEALDNVVKNFGNARRQITGGFAEIFDDAIAGRFGEAAAQTVGIFAKDTGAALEEYVADSRRSAKQAADAFEEQLIRTEYFVEGTTQVLRDFADQAEANLVPGLERGDAVARALRDNLREAANQIVLFGKIDLRTLGAANATIFLSPEELERAQQLAQEFRAADQNLARLNREFDTTIASVEQALDGLAEADRIRTLLTQNLDDTLRKAADTRAAARLGEQLAPLQQIATLEREIVRLRAAATDAAAAPDARAAATQQILTLEERIAAIRSSVSIPQLPGELLQDQIELVQQAFLRGEVSVARMTRTIQDLEDAARPVKTPLEELTVAQRNLDRLLTEGLISGEAYRRALEDLESGARPVKTTLEDMAEEQRRLNRLRADGLISDTAYARALEDLADKARSAATPLERVARETRQLDRALADGLISPEAYRDALVELREQHRLAATPLESYRLETDRLRRALADGFISQDAYNDAVEDLGDNLRAVKTPLEVYETELRTLTRLQRDGAISAGAMEKAIKDAVKAAGSAKLGDLQEEIGLLGDTARGRSAQRALDKATENAARGNEGAARENLRRVEELLGTSGKTIEEVIGRGLVDQARSNDAAAQQVAAAEESAAAAAARESEIQASIAARWERAGEALGLDLGKAADDLPDEVDVDAPENIPVDIDNLLTALDQINSGAPDTTDFRSAVARVPAGVEVPAAPPPSPPVPAPSMPPDAAGEGNAELVGKIDDLVSALKDIGNRLTEA
jgi:hypothetical protein